MKELFGARRVLVDGTEGKCVSLRVGTRWRRSARAQVVVLNRRSEIIMPALDYLQRSLAHVGEWIEYSTYDAESTWLLRNDLEARRLCCVLCVDRLC